MAYTPHNFQPGDTLSADIFNQLEQTVHDLGGKYVNTTDYIQILENNVLSNCTIESSEDSLGVIISRKQSSTSNNFGVVFPIGTLKDIKNIEYNISIKDISELSSNTINKLTMYLTKTNKYDATIDGVVNLGTVNSKKEITTQLKMSTYMSSFAETDMIYLMCMIIRTDSNPGQQIEIKASYPSYKFIDGASGLGQLQYVKNYYTKDAVTRQKSNVTLMDDGISYQINYTGADTANTMWGCVIPLDTYGNLKDKTIYTSLKDIASQAQIDNLRIYLTIDKAFDFTKDGIYSLQGNATVNSPYSATWKFPSLDLSYTDDQLVYVLLYFRYKNALTAGNVLQLQMYYTAQQWVETGVDLSNYYNRDEVDELISNGIGDGITASLSNYKLFTIGDSLCVGGDWQKECAARLGCTFEQAINKSTHPVSMGGTNSNMGRMDSTFYRTKNLIDYGGITDEGQNAIIILQNINDGLFTFNKNARAYPPMKKSFNVTEITAESLNQILEEDRGFDTALNLTSYKAGVVLTVDTLPTKEGTVTLNVGSAGFNASYNIYIEPQDTEEEMLEFIYDKILEYDYNGVFDERYENGPISGISFSSPNSVASVSFKDTDKTGMACSILNVDSVPFYTCYWFNSDDLSQWATPSLWKVPEISSGWKSSIELLLKTYPKAKIAIMHFPKIVQTQANYLLPNGLYDEVAFYDAINADNTTMITRCNAIGDLYHLKVFDMYSNLGINATNLTTYYNEKASIHPHSGGYKRIGEMMAGEIQGWIKQ